jgi:hypothetical protein
MDFTSISYIVLWVLVLALAMFSISASKKPKRVLPASNTGLPVGVPFPDFKIKSVVKEVPFELVNAQRKETIILFSSSMCPICNTVYPLLPMAEKRFDLLSKIIMEGLDGDEVGSIAEKVKTAGIQPPVYSLTPTMRVDVKLEGFPFAYFLSADGRVLAKGVVNTIADIELLISEGRRAGMRKLAG